MKSATEKRRRLTPREVGKKMWDDRVGYLMAAPILSSL